MALTDTQLALTKLYLAAFNRAPETGGLTYWNNQLNSGKSMADVVSTIFSLDIVTAIYPKSTNDSAFLTSIYNNIFGKAPDADGLAYWTNQLASGKDRSQLVMTMIEAGLGTPDGTPGKGYIVNRLESAKQAVEKQAAQGVEITPAKLLEIMAGVGADSATITTAAGKLDQYSGAKIAGKVADGYVKNATVFADANGNGVWDEGEAKTTTDANGDFVLTGAKGAIIATGGTDIATNLPHTGVLKAPEGSAVINPLTSLQQAMVEQGKSAAEAEQAVTKAFGIDTKVSLQDYDPLKVAFNADATADEKALAVKMQAAAAKVQNLLVTASNALVGAAGSGADTKTATTAVLSSLASNIAKDSDGVVSFTDQSLLKTVLEDSTKMTTDTTLQSASTKVADMSTTFATILAETAAKVDSVVNGSTGSNALSAIAQIAQVQTATQGTVAEKIQTAASSGSLSGVVGAVTGSALDHIVNTSKIGDLDPTSTTDSSVIDSTNTGGTSNNGGNSGGGGTTVQAKNLDSLNGTVQVPAAFDAGSGAFNFTDTIATSSFTKISHFGADDTLALTNHGSTTVVFESSGSNVIITANDGAGHVSQITLVGVTTPDSMIGSLAAFNALSVGDVTVS
ncbi:DUF4214 domain-containing protein [Herbaspirillum sp. HC18]|nr:DUF4214 domain-containing protein [Herbaspirillum sp. HC18]